MDQANEHTPSLAFFIIFTHRKLGNWIRNELVKVANLQDFLIGPNMADWDDQRRRTSKIKFENG